MQPLHPMPRPQLWLLCLGLLGACAGTSQQAAPPIGLETLRSLEGSWFPVTEGGELAQEPANVFRVTAGGSAVLEEVFPGQEHEMVTVYQQGAEGLELIHYCAAGNAPHMRLDPASTSDDLRFLCDGGVGITDHTEGHMHTGRIVRLGPDELLTEWGYWSGGQLEWTATFEVQRVEQTRQ